jgi:hypothetical protein
VRANSAFDLRSSEGVVEGQNSKATQEASALCTVRAVVKARHERVRDSCGPQVFLEGAFVNLIWPLLML